MRDTVVCPSAASPARIREALARRSVAMTGAPDNMGTPLTTALRPSINDIRAHAAEFRNMGEPVFEDCLVDDAGARGKGHQAHELGLHIGGKPGVGEGLDVDRLYVRIALDEQGPVSRL